MGTLRDIYRYLRPLNDPWVDRAMAAALPTADAAAVQLIVLSLLERQQPEGTLALVLNYHRLPAPIQQMIVGQVADLYRPLREASGRSDPQARMNVIQIIRLSRAMRLAYLLVDIMRRRDAKSSDEAAGCLLELAEAASTWPARSTRAAGKASSNPGADSAAMQYLQAAVEEAVESYAVHERGAAVKALAKLAPRPLGKLRGVLSDIRNPVVAEVRRQLEAGLDQDVRRAALLWMQVPALTESAMTGMRRAAGSALLGDVLGCAHLTLDRRVESLLMKAPNAALLAPGLSEIDQLRPHELRNLPVWLAALPLEAGNKVQRLGALSRCPDAPTRLSALRHLMMLSRDPRATGALAVIADFCDDPDPHLGRIALRFLTAIKWEGLVQLLLKLVNASHAEIRALAAEELAPLGFDRLWAAWARMSPARQLAAGRALIKIDANFHRMLGAKLNQPTRESRLRALSMIYRLNQAAFFEPALQALTQDDDERVASAAVRALGSCATSDSKKTLSAALDHPDSRVRANAIEALYEQDSHEHVERLTEIATGDEGRPRANAIGVLLQMQVNDALHALVDMLGDKRPEQRTSALWLIKRMDLVEVAQQVAELSISDPDPKVKQRAGQVIQHLIAALAAQGGPEAKKEIQS